MKTTFNALDRLINILLMAIVALTLVASFSSCGDDDTEDEADQALVNSLIEQDTTTKQDTAMPIEATPQGGSKWEDTQANTKVDDNTSVVESGDSVALASTSLEAFQPRGYTLPDSVIVRLSKDELDTLKTLASAPDFSELDVLATLNRVVRIDLTHDSTAYYVNTKPNNPGNSSIRLYAEDQTLKLSVFSTCAYETETNKSNVNSFFAFIITLPRQ